MQNDTLTARQKRVLVEAYRFHSENNYAASHRDLARRVGVNSTSLIHSDLLRLRDAGLLVMPTRMSRAVALTTRGQKMARRLSGAQASGARVNG